MSTISVRESISKIIENPWRFVRLRSLAMFLRLFQTPISLKDIIDKCNQPGFIPRTAFLEIDMMQGTAFPPDEILLENRVHTLQDIYLQAGIVLDIRLDENNVPDFAGTDPPLNTYNDGELDNLQAAHQNPVFQESGNKWSAYLVVATQNDRGDLGILFNDNDERRGCAVFHGEAIINTDNLAFFRTAAHELGHVFNLHHEDGTVYIEQGSTILKYSIMKETSAIQSSDSGWPDGVGLRLISRERRHLTFHEINNVRPGGARWKRCNQEHKSWHNDIVIED